MKPKSRNVHPLVERMRRIEEATKGQKVVTIPGKYAPFGPDEDEDEEFEGGEQDDQDPQEAGD